MDQLTSTVPGIEPQLNGRLTNTPIVGAQVFADHSSSPPLLHTHLLENLTLEETIKAKVGFERLSATFGVTVHHYRADNGRLATLVSSKPALPAVKLSTIVLLLLIFKMALLKVTLVTCRNLPAPYFSTPYIIGPKWFHLNYGPLLSLNLPASLT